MFEFWTKKINQIKRTVFSQTSNMFLETENNSILRYFNWIPFLIKHFFRFCWIFFCTKITLFLWSAWIISLSVFLVAWAPQSAWTCSWWIPSLSGPHPLVAVVQTLNKTQMALNHVHGASAEQNGGTLTDFERHVREFIEVRCIVDWTNLDWDRRRSLANVFPVDAAEKWYRLQFFNSSVRAHATFGVAAELDNGLLRLLGNWRLWWEYQCFAPIHDFPIRVLWIVRTEWWVSHQHLIHDHAQRPPVACWPVTSLKKHLQNAPRSIQILGKAKKATHFQRRHSLQVLCNREFRLYYTLARACFSSNSRRGVLSPLD